MTPYAGMREPRDADLDSRGRLWIADFGNNRIRVFDKEGGFLGGWGGRGAGTHGLREPGAVAIGEEDLYIADTWNGRIQGFGLDGTWKAKADGLYGPRGVAVSPDGRVWATDTGNHRLAVYRPDLTEPQFIGKNGRAPGEFQGPVGIAVSSAGQVYVADTGNKRIQIFGPDGEFRAAWKFPGWVSPGEPHLAIDSEGDVYATDPEAGKVVVFDAAGRPVREMTANQTGEKFSKPTGLALDRKARVLYVINSGNHTVTKLELPKGRP
jgi:DNA-binding beta-propeller fold protein YncE